MPRIIVRVAFVLVLFTAAESALAESSLRIVLLEVGDQRLSRKLRAEARQAGFDPIAAPHQSALEPREILQRTQAVALIEIGVDERVWIHTAATTADPAATEQFQRGPAEGETFPLRIIEALRARLFKLNLLNDGVAGRTTGSEAAPPGSALRKRTVEHASFSQPTPSRLWLHVGVGGTLPVGGLGPTLQTAVGVRLESSNGFGAQLIALLPLMENEIAANEGEADVNVNLFLAGLQRSLLRTRHWSATAGLGAGVLVLAMRAEAAAPYSAREDRVVTGAYCADASAAWLFNDWSALRATLLGGASGPRPVLRFDDRVAATWGRWFAAMTVQLELRLTEGSVRNPR